MPQRTLYYLDVEFGHKDGEVYTVRGATFRAKIWGIVNTRGLPKKLYLGGGRNKFTRVGFNVARFHMQSGHVEASLCKLICSRYTPWEGKWFRYDGTDEATAAAILVKIDKRASQRDQFEVEVRGSFYQIVNR